MSHGGFSAWCPEVPRLPRREGTSGTVLGDWAQLRPAAGKVARYVTQPRQAVSLGPCTRRGETVPWSSEAVGRSDVVETSTAREPLYEAAQRLRRTPFDFGEPRRRSHSAVTREPMVSANSTGMVSHSHDVHSASTTRSYDNAVPSNHSSQSTASTRPTVIASPRALSHAGTLFHASRHPHTFPESAKAGYGHLLEDAEAVRKEKSSIPQDLNSRDEPHARARELALACAALGMELQKLGDHLSWAEAYVGFEPEAEAEVDSPNLGAARNYRIAKELIAVDRAEVPHEAQIFLEALSRPVTPRQNVQRVSAPVSPRSPKGSRSPKVSWMPSLVASS